MRHSSPFSEIDEHWLEDGFQVLDQVRNQEALTINEQFSSLFDIKSNEKVRLCSQSDA